MVAFCYPPLYTYYFAYSTTTYEKHPHIGIETTHPHPLFFHPPVSQRLVQPDPPSMVPCVFHSHPVFPAPMPFKDITKQREASRRHYAKHRDKVITSAKKYSKLARDRTRVYIHTHLKTNPCVDCGETDPIILEFDHVTGTKEFNISDAAREGIGKKRLETEIAKCEVRCANCHRKKTYERSGWTHKD